jgi:cellulase
MKFQLFTPTVALLLSSTFSLLPHSADAHTQMNSVNGNRQAIRRTTGFNSPVVNLQSPNMVCGINAAPSAAAPLPVRAGERVTTKWFHERDAPTDGIIAESHKGPCNFYMAKLEPGQSLPTGAAWFKVFEDGFSNGKYCTDKLRENRGILPVTIPSQLASGRYLLRGEINALHEAFVPFTSGSRGAQFYIYCAELQVTGGSNPGEPSPKTVMPYLTTSSPGVVFNMYNTPGSRYPQLGINVATFTSPAAAAARPAAARPAPARPASTTTRRPAPRTTTTRRPAAATPARPNASTPRVPQFGQCGGINFTGPKVCQAPFTCRVSNPYYSQCL